MQTIRNLEVLSKGWKPSDPHSDVGQLYELLFLKGMSRESALEAFLGRKKSAAQFRNAYSLMHDRMLGQALSGGFNDCTPAQKNYFGLKRKDFGVEYLLNRGNKTEGAALATNAIQTGDRQQRYEICLNLARRLFDHYTNIDPNRSRMRFYRRKVEYFQQEQQYEIGTEIILNELTYAIREKEDISVWKDKLASCERGDGWRGNYNWFKSKILAGYYENNIKDVIDTCNGGLAFFKDQKILPSAVRFSLYFYKIPLLILLQRYEEASFEAANCEAMNPKGSLNWGLSVYLKCISNLHAGKYPKALAAYMQLSRAKDKSGSPDMRERKLILKAYFHLLARIGKVDLGGSFKLYKFLNELENASRDKKGQNVAVQLVHFLHLLADIKEAKERGRPDTVRRKMKAYMKKSESVRRFVDKHLKDGRDRRKYLALYMFTKVEHADYQKARTSELVRKSEKELYALPSTTDLDELEAAYIPLEQSWQTALSLLK